MTLEDWNTVFQFGSAILLGLTFLFGTAAILTGQILSRRQEARIASAQWDAAQANERAAEAEAGTATALVETAAIKERANKLELEAAKQRERAARAEKELLELQQRLAWRTFTTEQKRRFIAELSQFRGTRVVLLRIGDMEADLFARQIISILREAKWSLTENFAGVLGPPEYGVVCTYPPGDRPAETFIGLLESANILVERREGRELQITVGLRTPP